MNYNKIFDYGISFVSGFALSLLLTILKMNKFHIIGFSAIFIISSLSITNAYRGYTSLSKDEFDKATKKGLIVLTILAMLIWLGFEGATRSLDVDIRKNFNNLKVSGFAILLVYLSIWGAFLSDKNRTSNSLTKPQKVNLFFIISNGVCACLGLFIADYVNLVILALFTLILIWVETSFGLSNIKYKKPNQIWITSIAFIINLSYLVDAWPQH